MPFTPIDVRKEDRDYALEVEEVKKWWTSSRFRKIKRYVFVTSFAFAGEN